MPDWLTAHCAVSQLFLTIFSACKRDIFVVQLSLGAHLFVINLALGTEEAVLLILLLHLVGLLALAKSHVCLILDSESKLCLWNATWIWLDAHDSLREV